MKYDVFGIGNTLIDLMYQVDDEHLFAHRLKKGVMHLLDDSQVEDILKKHRHVKVIPAGATTNTLMGISALGGKCILFGKVGKGQYGDMYEDIITRAGVESRIMRSDAKTGKVLNFVTKDAERTFGVNLGAAVQMRPEEIMQSDIEDSKCFYFTGYEYESSNSTVQRAMDIAKKSTVKVAVDLADPELIKRNLKALKKFVKSVDILFLNETEAESFTGLGPKEAAEMLGKFIHIVIVKNGARGSFISAGKKLYRIKPASAKAIDTTGAGDLYAAGFLYGYLNGSSISNAGELGSYMGAKITEQVGALVDEKLKNDLKLVKNLQK